MPSVANIKQQGFRRGMKIKISTCALSRGFAALATVVTAKRKNKTKIIKTVKTACGGYKKAKRAEKAMASRIRVVTDSVAHRASGSDAEEQDNNGSCVGLRRAISWTSRAERVQMAIDKNGVFAAEAISGVVVGRKKSVNRRRENR